MSSRVTTEMGDRLSIYQSHPGQFSLVIPLWVGKMSARDGYSYPGEENGE